MIAVDVCKLPATGGTFGLALAAVVFLAIGFVVARWVRASAGRVAVVAVVPLLLLGIGAATTRPSSTSCNSSTVTTTVPSVTTTVPSVTTTIPSTTNLVLQIDTALLPLPSSDDDPSSSTSSTSTTTVPSTSSTIVGRSVTALDSVFVYELGLFGDVDVQVDWGDGTNSTFKSTGKFAHTYAASGQYTITISGSLTGFGQAYDEESSEEIFPLAGAEFLKSVDSFGELGIESLSLAFYGSNNLESVPAEIPSTVTSLFGIFAFSTSFDQSLSSWDTSNVTDMSGMFDNASSFDQSLSSWDISNVIDMSYMFFGATSFNQSLSSWDTSNVTGMSYMFTGATSFDQSLSSWDTGKVTGMSYMFAGATSFDQNLGEWNIGFVLSMEGMLDDSALSVGNYDATLIGWENGLKQNNVVLGATGLQFGSLGSIARESLNCLSGWTFTGDILFLESTSSDGDQIVTTAC